MKPRKPKNTEPSLRDKLSAAYLEAFQKDFEANGIAVIEALRKESPAKYAEIASRLIAATSPTEQKEGFASDTSMEAVGQRLLKSIGLDEPTAEQIEQAIEANTEFIAQLEAIRDRAQFGELGNGHADTIGES
jgi:hypothetical protein